MDIIVKKYSDSNRFKPGYNIALGKDIRSSKEYVSELKKRNLEPYDRNFRQAEPKAYKPSERSHEITRAIKRRTDKHGNVEMSDTLHKEIGAYLPGKSKSSTSLSNLNTKSGGFSNGDKNNGKIKR